MSNRTSSWLAWSLAGLCVAMYLASVALSVSSLYAGPATQPSSDWGTGRVFVGLLLFVPFLAFPIVGALIASRRPENPIGWICLVAGLYWMLIFLEDSIPSSVSAPVMIDALTQWTWVPPVGLLGIYMILLFPDGRLPSRRWCPLAWLSGELIVVLPVRWLGYERLRSLAAPMASHYTLCPSSNYYERRNGNSAAAPRESPLWSTIVPSWDTRPGTLRELTAIYALRSSR